MIYLFLTTPVPGQLHLNLAPHTPMSMLVTDAQGDNRAEEVEDPE